MSSFSRSKNLTSSPKATISDESPTSPTRRIRLSDTHWRRFCEIVIWHGWRLQHTSLVLPNWYQWPAPSRLACRKPSSFLTPTCTTDLSPSHPNLIQRQVSNKPWLKRRGPETSQAVQNLSRIQYFGHIQQNVPVVGVLEVFILVGDFSGLCFFVALVYTEGFDPQVLASAWIMDDLILPNTLGCTSTSQSTSSIEYWHEGTFNPGP